MNRPFVRMNVAATVDGKVDTFERRGASISSARDKQRVDELRATSDGVMIGGRTMHDEDPGLTVKSEALQAARVERGLPPNPAKIAIASRLDLRPDCKFLSAGPARILLFTTAQTASAQLEMLRSSGALVHVTDGERVDLEDALRTLKGIGIQRLLVEGGATLNFALLSLGLVDELTVYVAPMIFGGESAPTLAGGPGLPRDRALALKLVASEQWEDGGVLLHYKAGAA